MDSGNDPPADRLAANVSAAVNALRDAYRSLPPHDNSQSISSASPPAAMAWPPFSPDAWDQIIGLDQILSDAGIEFDDEDQIDDDNAIQRLLEMMGTDSVEVIDAVSDPVPQTFDTITRSGTQLPPPLAMPGRPSTISKITDNQNLGISEWLDEESTAAQSPNSRHSTGPPPPNDDSIANDVLPPHSIKDKFDPEQPQEGADTCASNSVVKKRSCVKSPIDLSLAPVVAKISEMLLNESTSKQIIDSTSRPGLSLVQSTSKGILQAPKGIPFSSEVSVPSPGKPSSSASYSAAAPDTPLLTCSGCDKAYKKKAYLLKHEADGQCKLQNQKPLRMPVFAGIQMMKLSMTDQELIDNGLPNVQYRNEKGISYCTACKQEFSNPSRLRRHVRRSCPVLREHGVYNQPQNQKIELNGQGSALALPETGTGYLLMDEGKSETDNSRPFSKPDLGNLRESLDLSDTPINIVGPDNNFAPNTVSGPRPSPGIKRALFPVSGCSPDQINFLKDNDCAKKTPEIKRLPGQVIQLTSQQLERLRLPLPGKADLVVMEETNIGEKVYKAESMVEIPALCQSHDPSPLKSAHPALIRSTARSQNMVGSRLNQGPTPKRSRDTAALKGSASSPQIDTEKNGEASPQLPKLRSDNNNDDDKPDFKYPERMRLFSEELALSSPHKSDPLEPFEDLPQNSKYNSARKLVRFPPSIAQSIASMASTTQDIVGNPPTVIFSFANEGICAISAQRLEELIMAGVNPALRGFRMWPTFSGKPCASRSTFEFKVTAPENVDLVVILREIFPLMVTRVRGDQLLLVPGDLASSNLGSPA